jgi:hypothetical protein
MPTESPPTMSVTNTLPLEANASTSIPVV